jgi:hypothetical protein
MYSITALTYGPNTSSVPPGASASALNKYGDVVGSVEGEVNSEVELGGAVWFHNNPPFFTSPSMNASDLNDINDSGTAAGRVDGHAVLIDKNGAITDLSVKVPGAQTAQEAYAINNSGLVCAGNDDGQPGLIIDSVLFTVKQALDTLANISDALPLTINDAGDFAGTCWVNGESHGFWCHNENNQQICADLGPNLGPSFKLNNQGVLVGTVDAQPVMWTWDTAQFSPVLKPLPLLPQSFSEGWLFGVNNSGAVVGSDGSVALLCDGKTWADLNTQIGDPNWVLSEAHAINEAGQIAGTGYLNGVETAFLLTPPPLWQGPQINALLELMYVSLGVMVDGGGPTSGGPVDPWSPLTATGEAALGLAINAVASRVSDAVGRDALRGAALEMTRRSVDRLIAQAKTPAPRAMPPQQGGGLRGRLRRKRLARAPRPPEGAPKS